MKATKILTIFVLFLGLMVCLPKVSEAAPMGTAWTYQGRLMDDNQPVDGIYDLECKLFDSSDPCAAQVGPTLSFENGEVLDGYITVHLDFGVGIFDGNERWLELGIRPGDSNDANDYVTLSPRQEVTPTPCALYAKTAGNALIGSGGINRIIKFTGPNTLGNSALYEDNYYVGVGTTNPRGMFDVDCDGGDIYIDTFGSQIYIGDVDGDGDETIFTVDDGAGKFTFENGNVGIGTTNPTRRLVVNRGGLDVYAGSSGEEITFNTERLLMTNSNEDIIMEAGEVPSDYVAFSNAGSEVMAVKNGGVAVGGAYTSTTPPNDGLIVKGNVGIGTTSPGAKLEVKGENHEAGLRVAWGSSYPNLYGDFKHTGSGGLKINANANGGWADMSLQTDGTTRLFIESGGKVGVGTNLPAEKLHVAGNLKVNGTITNGPGNVKTPIAYGIIHADGSLGPSSSNVSGSFWNTTLNRYEITISGESLDWTSYIFNVTYINLNAPRFITASVENGRLIVEIWSPSSTKVIGRFHFVVYKI
jgi:hypothetical protein